MDELSKRKLLKQQQELVQIEREILKLLPKLQDCSNMLKVEELQLKSCALMTNPMTGNTPVATPPAATEPEYTENEFSINQQEIMLDMLLTNKQEEEEEEEDSDYEFL